MKVFVISNDRVYSRMLYLSITDIGVNCETYTSDKLEDTKEADMILLDSAVYDRVKNKLGNNAPIILYGPEKDIHRIDERGDAPFFLLAKPFKMDVLFSIITSGSSSEQEENKEKRKYGIVIDVPKRAVFVMGEQVFLSKREFELFTMLMNNRGQTVTREMAASIFQDEEEEQKSNVVDVYVKYLRKKIDERFDIKLIKTVRGQGYTII